MWTCFSVRFLVSSFSPCLSPHPVIVGFFYFISWLSSGFSVRLWFLSQLEQNEREKWVGGLAICQCVELWSPLCVQVRVVHSLVITMRKVNQNFTKRRGSVFLYFRSVKLHTNSSCCPTRKQGWLTTMLFTQACYVTSALFGNWGQTIISWCVGCECMNVRRKGWEEICDGTGQQPAVGDSDLMWKPWPFVSLCNVTCIELKSCFSQLSLLPSYIFFVTNCVDTK